MKIHPGIVVAIALVVLFVFESAGSVGNDTDTERLIASIDTLNAAVVVVGAFLIYGVFARRE